QRLVELVGADFRVEAIVLLVELEEAFVLLGALDDLVEVLEFLFGRLRRGHGLADGLLGVADEDEECGQEQAATETAFHGCNLTGGKGRTPDFRSRYRRNRGKTQRTLSGRIEQAVSGIVCNLRGCGAPDWSALAGHAATCRRNDSSAGQGPVHPEIRHS